MGKRLIYAEDAIKELSEALAIVVKDNEKSAKFIIDRVPSVQPEQSTEVRDILQYLDKYLHPIVSPEHWSVYSMLYDMVSMLSSAQIPQVKGKWIHDGYDIPHGVDWMHCSVCGRREPYVPAAMTNFCPNCGADMRGEQG